MEPIIVLPAKQVEELINRYEQATARLIEAERELAALKENKYVTWEWVCAYFNVSKVTAMQMLASEKLFVFGQQIKRFKQSTIVKFAEQHSIKVKQIAPMPFYEKRELKRKEA